MFKSFRTILYQLRAPTVKTADHMIDSNSVHFPVYPLSGNLQRMMRFSGSLNDNPIAPLEVSDFLYQISNEDVEEYKKELGKTDYRITILLRPYSLFYNKKNLIDSYSKKALRERESFVRQSSEYLKRSLKICSVEDLPVALASNSIYAACKLNLELDHEINSVFIPLVKKKMKYMHAKGIIETIWGLVSMKSQDKNLVESLVNELKSRPRVKHTHVVTSPYNHLEYVIDPEPSVNNSSDLLAKASELATDQELKNNLAKLSEEYR